MTSSDTPLQPVSAAEGAQPVPQAATSLIGRRDAAWFLPGVFLALPLLWVIAYFLPPLNQDVAAVLAITERWLAGEQLYIDVIDVNPPLVFMLNLLPVALADVLPISSAAALMGCVLALSLWAVWASHRLLVSLAIAEERTVKLLLLPLLLFVMVVFPSEMFGQREHLMALGMFPYLLLAAARCESRPTPWPLSLSIAIVAALGFALKPHFLIIPASVELYLLVVRGWRRSLGDPVPWLMLAVMALYVLAAWTITPSYFSFVLPLVMSAYEGLGGSSYFKIVTGRYLAPYLLVLIPLTVAAFRGNWPHAMRLTAIAGFAAAIAGVAQDKGWPYHLLPSEMAAVLMMGWALTRVMDQLGRSGETAVRASLSVIGLFLLFLYAFAGASRYALYDQMDYASSQAGQWQRVLERHANGASVLMLTPGIYPHFPAMNYVDVKEASRFLTVWPLQGAYEGCKPNDPRYHTPDQMTETEKLFNRMTIEDLVKKRPRLVVIDRIPGIPWCGGKEFDFLEYFLQQPAFAAEWQNYEFIAPWDRYQLYRRKTHVSDK